MATQTLLPLHPRQPWSRPIQSEKRAFSHPERHTFTSSYSRDSGLEAFPDFDAAFDDCVSSIVGDSMPTEAFYFSTQPSEDTLAHSPALSAVSRKPSVLLPECHLVKPYRHQTRHSADKPLPPTPLQPQLTTRKRSNRSVTTSQLQQLQRAVTPTPPFEWNFPSDFQGSFSSTDSAVPPSLSSTTTASPRSTMTTVSPMSRPTRELRQDRVGSPAGFSCHARSVPMPLDFAGPSMEENPAYMPVTSPTFSEAQLLPSPDFCSSFQSSEPQTPLDCAETSGWEPDSDDEHATRALRKKISRKFNADRTSRPRTLSSATSAPEVPTQKHASHLSSSSATSYSSSPAARVSRSTAYSMQSATLPGDVTPVSRPQRPTVQRMHTSPSICAMPGKRKVKFGRRLKGWFAKSS